MTCATAVTFSQGMGPERIEAFDSNLTDVIQFTGIAILVL